MYPLTSKTTIKAKNPLNIMTYMCHSFSLQNPSIFNRLYQVALSYHEFHCQKDMNSVVGGYQHANVATKKVNMILKCK